MKTDERVLHAQPQETFIEELIKFLEKNDTVIYADPPREAPVLDCYETMVLQ